MPVRILLDENLPFVLLTILEERGYTVFHIKKLGKSGIKNGEVYKLAEELGCWLFTRDADFQNLERFLRSNISGIVVFKLSNQLTSALLVTIQQLLRHEGSLFSASQLVIVDDHEVRTIKRTRNDK